MVVIAFSPYRKSRQGVPERMEPPTFIFLEKI